MKCKYIAMTSAMAIALGLSVSASAATINFDQANGNSPTGSISYGGNGGALTGSDITFGAISLNSESGTAPQSALTCESCAINFTTGDNNQEGGSVGSMWTFDGGGNLTLSGNAIDPDGNTVASGTLFSGSFDGNSQLVVRTGQSSLSADLAGSDDFNSDLAGYFGLSDIKNFDFSSTEIALGSATFGGDGSFSSSDLQNADVTVQGTPSTTSVPAPAPFGLFALGLALVAGGLGFRRKQGGSIG